MPLQKNQQTKSLASPLVRKKRKARPITGPIPGVKHTIEGYEAPKYQAHLLKGEASSDPTADWQKRMGILSQNVKEGEKEDQFFQKQEARSRITPIVDPDAGIAERRKKAARRRMRGRLGTLLSQRETLG